VNFRLVVAYLQFPIQVCFSILSVCRPCPASRAHHHRQPCGFNNSIDYIFTRLETYRTWCSVGLRYNASQFWSYKYLYTPLDTPCQHDRKHFDPNHTNLVHGFREIFKFMCVSRQNNPHAWGVKMVGTSSMSTANLEGLGLDTALRQSRKFDVRLVSCVDSFTWI